MTRPRILTTDQVQDILDRWRAGESLRHLSADLGVSRRTVGAIIAGERYTEVTGLTPTTPATRKDTP